MNKRLSKIMVIGLALTVAFASLAMGYGLWSGSITITEIIETGNIDLAFVDDAGIEFAFSKPVTLGVPTLNTPYSTDDNRVDSAVNDPNDPRFPT